MVYIKTPGAFILILFWIIPSCVKNTATIEYTAGDSTQVITTAQDTVKKGEPITITANAPNTNSTVQWTVLPSDSTVVVPNGNQVKIYFNLPGVYQITANFFSPANAATPYDSSRYTVIVNDSLYTPPPFDDGFDTIQLAGDPVIIVPNLLPGDSGLAIIVQTVKLYSCSAYLTAYGFGMNGPPLSTIEFLLKGTEIIENVGHCIGNQIPAATNPVIIPPTNGIYSISVERDQQTYSGTLTVSDSAYTFSWNYTSGVTISTKQIKKK